VLQGNISPTIQKSECNLPTTQKHSLLIFKKDGYLLTEADSASDCGYGKLLAYPY
jgi:hypothetical protein